MHLLSKNYIQARYYVYIIIGRKNLIKKIVNDGTKITPKDSMSFVIVASPANYHIKHSLFFAKKRFHILVEKPLTTNKTLLHSFLSEFKKNNFIFHVGYNMRFLTSIIMMKKIIKTKKYGDIVHANITAFSNFINWRPI